MYQHLKSNLAILCCDSGLGHLKRMSYLAEKFNTKKFNVTIYADKKKFFYLKKKKIIKSSIFFKHLKTYTSYTNLKKNFQNSTSWHKRIKEIDKYDLVISDNLPEILEVRPDAILFANFFWHEVIPNYPLKHKLFLRNIIKKNSPYIFGFKYFAQKHIKKQKNFNEVNLFQTTRLRKKQIKNSVLFTSGYDGNLKLNFDKKFFDKLNLKSPLKIIYYIEPRYYKKNFPNNVKKAIYSKFMYQSLFCTIGRPGMSTVMECINSKVKFFSMYEKQNIEMFFNSNIIKKLKLGKTIKNQADIAKEILNYVNSNSNQKIFNKNINKIKLNNIKLLVKKIEKIGNF